jgi:hypothetical protein
MPSSLRRRRLLLGIGTGLAAPLSGCSAASRLTRTDRRVRITEIRLKNLDDHSRVFDVVVLDAEHDEVVFWRTYAARAMVDRDGDGNEEIDATVWEDPVSSTGEYVVHVRARQDTAGGERDIESVRLPADSACLAVTVEVGLMRDLSITYDDVRSC